MFGEVTPEFARAGSWQTCAAGRPLPAAIIECPASPTWPASPESRWRPRAARASTASSCATAASSTPRRSTSTSTAAATRPWPRSSRRCRPEQVIDELKISGLRGRGGAGFPAWLKWSLTRESEGDEHLIVCNGDEGDPGAYMDRSVLEGDPHAVLEGMIIGGYVIGAKQGFFYIRAEYPLAIQRIEKAIRQAQGERPARRQHPGHGLQLQRRGPARAPAPSSAARRRP